MSVFSIQLEARDPAHNRFRAYRLDVARDLFGFWLVEVKFGRIGAKGRRLVSALDDELAARRMVRERLQRRGRRPSRIGVAYQTLERWDPYGWMPATPTTNPGRAPCIEREREVVQRLIAPIAVQCDAPTGEASASE
jgi:hypothetical protein